VQSACAQGKIATVVIAATLLLAACGGDSDDGAQPAPSPMGTTIINSVPPTFTSTGPGPPRVEPEDAKLPQLTAGARFGEDPMMTFDGRPPNDIVFEVLSEGDGPEVQGGDVIVTDFRGQIWQEDNLDIPPFENTFDGDPAVKRIDKGDVMPAWDLKIPGTKVGSRVMLIAPPAAAFGHGGKPQAGILGIDTLAFVIDIIDTFSPAKLPDGEKVTPPDGLPAVDGDFNPAITPPKSDPPSELVSQVLIRGKGEAVEVGQTIAVNYRGVLWRDGKPFDTSWRQDGPAPLGFHLGSAQIIKGWNEGLVGKTVGSRVLLVVPPELGYGSKGNEGAGIKATDVLVFVVDILGAY
jgi:peptidylprolyl isomerase